DIGDPDGDLYHMPWIFRMDRSRWAGSGFDWTVIPTPAPNPGPLSEDFDVIQNSVQDTVVADLDGDGRKEILFSSYDGRVHAFWLDKTQHGSWPYRVPAGGAGDEVRFTSWPKNGGNRIGHLHVLTSMGVELFRIQLPAPFGDDWNGGLAAPTVANIDADADLELVVGTTSSGVVAYDLPGTSNARIIWGTGRGNQKRTGAVLTPSVSVGDV